MVITKRVVAEKIGAYLRHEITLEKLVDWSENALMNGELEESEIETLRTVVARLGVADVRAFGLTWEDCEQALRELGFGTRVEIVTR
jgi:hypothetical protein